MAKVTITSGIRKGRIIEIPTEDAEIEKVFKKLMLKKVLWSVDVEDLKAKDAFKVKIFDFSCRCTRNIFFGVPIFLNDSCIRVDSTDSESVDDALRKVINLLEISGGDIRIIQDNEEELRLITIDSGNVLDFLDAGCIGNA